MVIIYNEGSKTKTECPVENCVEKKTLDVHTKTWKNTIKITNQSFICLLKYQLFYILFSFFTIYLLILIVGSWECDDTTVIQCCRFIIDFLSAWWGVLRYCLSSFRIFFTSWICYVVPYSCIFHIFLLYR